MMCSENQSTLIKNMLLTAAVNRGTVRGDYSAPDGEGTL